MENVIYVIRVIVKLSFFIWFIVLFYLSLKKCFWQERLNKTKMVFLSILTSPFLSFLIAYYTSLCFFEIFKIAVRDAVSTTMYFWNMVILAIAGAGFYLILISLFTKLMCRYLGAKEISAVFFVYLMFNVISVLSLRGTGSALIFSSRILTEIIDIAGVLILYFASVLLYRLDICSLAKLTGVNVNVNWKVFTVPPAFFSFFYAMLMFMMIVESSYNALNGETALVIYIFSTIISFLFIWAFHVIIKNINATNEAIKAKDEVKTLSVEVMEALAHTIDAKDEYTRGHSVRVANYSRMIAEKMGLSSEACENIYYMGLLHDLGKIGVPNEIINSPTKLTDDEYAVIKTHPGLGFDILSEIRTRPDLVIGARWHHERYDGKGYPDGKSGEDIPLMARIIAVADSYDAMTSNRSYRCFMPQDKVRSEIEKNAGTQFDPEVAKCMIAIMESDVEYKLHE